MSISVEYQAARSGVALMRRAWRELVHVVGDGRVGFLQSMLSSDVQSLSVGDGCRALLLDNKGKIQGDLDLWVESEAIVMACDAAVVGTVLGSLRKYVLATPVQFQELGDDEGVLGLIGPQADVLLQNAGVTTLPGGSYGHTKASLAGVEVRLARTPALAADGLEIHGPEEALAEVAATLRGAAEGSLLDVGDEVAEVLRVEAGLPRHGSELTGEQFPQEAGLDDAINYEKGCYLGQETVARIHYRGEVNRLLVGLHLSGRVTTGAGLFFQESEVGVVTSAVACPRLGPIGLGYVRREAAAAGTELTLPMEESEPLTAKISDLPFQPEGE